MLHRLWALATLAIHSGCGKTEPTSPPPASIAQPFFGAATKPTYDVTKDIGPRVILKEMTVAGVPSPHEDVELTRSKTIDVECRMQAGAWGFSRLPTIVRADDPRTHSKLKRPHPVVAADPMLDFVALIHRGGEANQTTFVSPVVGIFVPQEKPNEGLLIFSIPTPPGDGLYTVQFMAINTSAGLGPDGKSIRDVFATRRFTIQ
jgi:hypothetical protein